VRKVASAYPATLNERARSGMKIFSIMMVRSPSSVPIEKSF